ncbi:SGNH/GDSL hydrolase family protein [Endozoicomonas sp. ALD040]|uniref:SGNH/GDSL hydrolase family protein n=1 Tax=unclassified Endozoicomonas TaxID=2644528 RepID=UPI003BAEFD98
MKIYDLIFIVLITMISTPTEAYENKNNIEIIAIGTSLTKRGIWLEELSNELSKCLSAPVKHLNFGYPGRNIEYGLSQLDLILKNRADFFLIEFSVNDADLIKGVTFTKSKEQTTTLINNIRTTYPEAKIIMMKMNPALGLKKVMRPRLKSFYDIYDQFATLHNVFVIDFYEKWESILSDELKENIPDGIHPAPTYAARVMVPPLLKLLSNENCTN